MKRLLISASMLAALGLTIAVISAHTRADVRVDERANIEFTQAVKLVNVVLKGEYFIKHDDERMAKGEDCTYVYDTKGKLIVSFHCTPIERPKAERFRVVTRRIEATGLSEIVEIQFAGSTEAHQVP